MRFEEVIPGALTGRGLHPVSGEARLQYGGRWLDFAAGDLSSICGPGARLSVLLASEGGEPAAAIPVLRTSPGPGPRPFPLDFEDMFFGLWIRNLDPADRALRARAALSRALGALLGAANPSMRRAIVLHAPLSPVSEALVAPRLSPAVAREALRALLDEARRIAAAEGRCALIPRLPRRHAGAWGGALAGWTRVPGYSNAEYFPGAPPDRRVRQMVHRNRRRMDHAGAAVQAAGEAPADFPFGALFSATAHRHRDPAPRLGDRFFQGLAARFAPDVRFLLARRDGHPVGFVAVIRQGPVWEAFKCGTDRALAGPAPVYLDLLYGRLRDLAALEGVARVDLGPGELDVKQHYGAALCPVDSYVALPPGFRGGSTLTAYLRAVGEGITRREAG